MTIYSKNIESILSEVFCEKSVIIIIPNNHALEYLWAPLKFSEKSLKKICWEYVFNPSRQAVHFRKLY